MDTLSVVSDDDYDVISNPSQRSLESSLADLDLGQGASEVHEPPPSQAAREMFEAVRLSAEDIQAYVRKTLEASRETRGDRVWSRSEHRVVRIYVDGAFDSFNTGHALQLRQAKLSFPRVHLIVGIFSDELCENHDEIFRVPHVERCEVVRHCRWVDEVVSDASWEVESQFIRQKRIDYIALDEGASVDPHFNKSRLRGYDSLKKLGLVIPTRKTAGLALNTTTAAPSPVWSPNPFRTSDGALPRES